MWQVFAKYVSATITGPPIERDAWAHIVCTYDGTVARMYVNSQFVQVSPPAHHSATPVSQPVSLSINQVVAVCT